jgi:hypothetical protein
MYFRNPDYLDVEHWAKIAGADADADPGLPQIRPLLSIALVLVPVLATFLVLAVAHSVA